MLVGWNDVPSRTPTQKWREQVLLWNFHLISTYILLFSPLNWPVPIDIQADLELPWLLLWYSKKQNQNPRRFALVLQRWLSTKGWQMICKWQFLQPRMLTYAYTLDMNPGIQWWIILGDSDDWVWLNPELPHCIARSRGLRKTRDKRFGVDELAPQDPRQMGCLIRDATVVDIQHPNISNSLLFLLLA